jgi:hypothetical protein
MPQFSDDLFLGSAQAYQGTGVYAISATFTGSIASTTLTVTAMLSGDSIVLGQYVSGSSVTVGSYITAFVSGAGGVGTYTVSAASTAASTTIYAGGNALLGDPSPMDLGVGPLGRIYVWDCIPLNKAASNVATASVYTSAITLTAGTGVKSVTNNSGATVLQLDVPRTISVTTGAGASVTSRNITISGFDYYGQAMSEVIVSSETASTGVNGKKAFYQISSATISGSAVVTIALSTTNTLGFPVRVTNRGYITKVGWDDTLAADAGVLVVAATATATTTTGDVRGTYAPSGDPDGIKRLVVGILLPAIAVGPNATRAGAFGVTQA